MVIPPTSKATHAQRTPAGRDAAPGAAAAGSIPSVLLVDDRPENLAALEAILEPLSLRLVRATSGAEALRLVLREQFAVILLDVQMPGTDGLQTAKLIKQRAKSEHVPIIFLTAVDQDRRYVNLGYESGAVDYLFKPLDPAVLRAKVSAFVEFDRLRGALAEQQGRRFADLAVQESEERYRLVQQATNDVIWDWDLATGVVRWNDLAATVFGIPAVELSNDADWWASRIHPDDRARVVDGIQAVIDGGPDASWSAEYRFMLGDGSYRTFLDRAFVARDEAGRPIRAIGAMQDITQRIRARESAEAAHAAAEQARQAAEAASRLKSEFLATMSHEFRTPLNAILGYAQLLDMGVLGPATPAQHAHLERLQASARHLIRLVDDVLDVAKIDADRLEVRRDALLTGAAIAAAVAVVQPQATARGVRLSDDGERAPGVPYLGDEHRVRQVLLNLLSNAVKFTPPGGQVSIVCGLAIDPEPGVWRAEGDNVPESAAQEPGWAFIRIEDTGPGIAPQLLERLFEPFVQGDSALTRAQGGTGLGLAISRRLARLMGGDITARTRPGNGAAFTLWLRSPGASSRPGAEPASLQGSRHAAVVAGMAIGEQARQALDADAYAVLHAIGVRLSADAETIASRYVASLRADESFPGAKTLPSVQLRDHATPVIGLLASQLMVIGETHGAAPELLGDGGQMQRVMAELHGAQRHRLGWSEADIERETPLLLSEIERAVTAALDTRATGALTGASAIPAINDAAVQSAGHYAVDASRHMLEQGTRTAIRAHRFAKAADTP